MNQPNPNLQKIKEIQAKVVKVLSGLSPRENAILLGSGLIILGMAFYSVRGSVGTMFASQSETLKKLDVNAKALPGMLKNYTRLKSRRDEIEKRYNQVDKKNGALSHLEGLLRDKEGIAPGFTITDKAPVDFANKYEQTTFSLKFRTSTVRALIQLLTAIVHGNRQLLLTRLDVTKNTSSNRLEVELDVSTISEKS